MNNLTGKYYYPPEVSIVTDLNWDMEKIIAVYEYLRQNFYKIVNNIPDNLELRLTSFSWKGGKKYPIIAIFTDDMEDSSELQSFTCDPVAIEEYINNIGLDELVKRSQDLSVPKWENLKSGGVYPE
jgi:hypothetical protein